MLFRRKNCDDVLSRHEFTPAMLFCGKYPDCVSGTYEEHNIDILRKNRVFTRFFAPFWHFGSVTKKSRNADIFRILVGRELMSAKI